MREFPITSVPSHVYHINSSASNLFDGEQYHRKLTSNVTDNNFHHLRQQTSSAQCNNNKNSVNYICASNGDLTSLQGARIQNHNSNNDSGQSDNNCNRATNKNAINNGNNKNSLKIDDRDVENNKGNLLSMNTSGSFSILDALTNAVTTGNRTSAIYPLNECNNVNEFDQINLDADQLSSATTNIHNKKNAQSNAHNSIGQFKHYNYNFGNNRPHQFPSTNYKHSYLLWIGTPVAARYTINYTNRSKFIFVCFFSNIQLNNSLFCHLVCFSIFSYIFLARKSCEMN